MSLAEAKLRFRLAARDAGILSLLVPRPKQAALAALLAGIVLGVSGGARRYAGHAVLGMIADAAGLRRPESLAERLPRRAKSGR